MKKTQRLFLIWFLLIAGFTISCPAIQPLPDGWWLQDSPEKVLAKAQAINQSLNFYQAEKTGSPFSQITNPFMKTNDSSRVEFFQRKSANGFVETKTVHLDKNYQSVEYKLGKGNYFLSEGQIIKQEFYDGDDWEKRLGIKLGHSYEYKMLKSEMVGSNDCIVIARIMSEPLLTAATESYYKKYSDSPEERKQMGEKYIRSEIDYYFRKTDGITFGYVKRNRSGEILDNYLYDTVQINQPIPDGEFVLPEGEIKIAKSFNESLEIMRKARATKLTATRKNSTATAAEQRVSELPWATNLPSALVQAKAENKIVLLDFTGSDWCVWCMKFDNDVLSKPEFAAYAKTNLVMVMLDFPNAIKQSEALKKSNRELQEEFKIDGFPTYVALDADGKEIGRQVGYLSGGPEAFIAEFKKFREQ